MTFFRKILIAASMILAGTGAVAQDDIDWQKGWIAQSYGIRIGADAPKPHRSLSQ